MATKKTSAPAAAPTPTFNLRKPQEPLLQLLMTSTANVHAMGSSRVGKSWLLKGWQILLADWYPGSRHGVFRRNRNACEQNLFKITLPQVLDSFGLTAHLSGGINKSDLTLTFPNGSVISYHGLDENNRDRILGSEFQTIWMNEVSEFDYDDVEFLKGRLYKDIAKDHERAPPGMPDILKHRMFYDCNPGTFDDWDYKLFHQKINPNTRKPLLYPEDYEYVRMVTDDEEYIRRNADASDEWKERFIYANWTASNPNALFQRAYINDYRHHGELPAFKHVVVGVDPAVTAGENSDWTGIVVAGLGHDGHAYVLADLTVKSMDWEYTVIQAFDDFKADEVIAEGNQGGSLVTKVIHQATRGTGKFVTVERVHARRDKEMRAKPIADKYREGRVHHDGSVDLSELETEMCSFGGPAHKGKSPDRMDALVWALWRLFEIDNTTGPNRMSITPVTGQWR